MYESHRAAHRRLTAYELAYQRAEDVFVQQSLLIIAAALCIGKACTCWVSLQTLVVLTRKDGLNPAQYAAI